MTDPAARWERVEALFDGALERPRTDRVNWVRGQAGPDLGLRDEVLAMLAAHDSADGVLDRPLPIPDSSGKGVTPELAAALGDRYLLDHQIGVGGTAAVFQARQIETDRDVVIKVLLPDFAARFGVRRFRIEMELATRLIHPHILGLIDSGEAGEILYYVMPYLGGETLRSRLKRGRPELPEALTLLRDVADALAYAHREGVVHRDLKPENVLCVNGRALLMDFGIARYALVLGQTTVGAVLGTPGYMAPEQRDGREVDHRADLWAWGVVARELVVGGRSTDPIVESTANLPQSVIDTINACLSVKREARPESADSLVRSLEGLTVP
jgi:eukaryotic-like serine/threonine-protein kinase